MAGRCFHRNDAELFPLFHLSALRAAATAAYDRRPIEVIIDIIRVEMRRMILS